MTMTDFDSILDDVLGEDPKKGTAAQSNYDNGNNYNDNPFNNNNGGGMGITSKNNNSPLPDRANEIFKPRPEVGMFEGIL